MQELTNTLLKKNYDVIFTGSSAISARLAVNRCHNSTLWPDIRIELSKWNRQGTVGPETLSTSETLSWAETLSAAETLPRTETLPESETLLPELSLLLEPFLFLRGRLGFSGRRGLAFLLADWRQGGDVDLIFEGFCSRNFGLFFTSADTLSFEAVKVAGPDKGLHVSKALLAKLDF